MDLQSTTNKKLKSKDGKGLAMKKSLMIMFLSVSSLCGMAGMQQAAADNNRECKSNQLVRTGGTAKTEYLSLIHI